MNLPFKKFLQANNEALGEASEVKAETKTQAEGAPHPPRAKKSTADKAPESAVPSWLSALRKRLSSSAKPLLLLAWDIGGLKAAIYTEGGGKGQIVASAEALRPHFSEALGEVLAALAQQSALKPVRVVLATRYLLPGVVNLPVNPAKPRPLAQMRELVQSEIEPILAEFGSLWSLGALLEARQHLSASERENVTREEALRRDGRRTPLRYGETALEMELIERPALDECLDLQERLQNLDSTVVSGWRGRIEDNRSFWLACGVGRVNYREWQDALAERRLHLTACLPLSWLASEVEPETDARPDSTTISLELHQEEVVAIHRQNGRVMAVRSEGRMERALHSDWLARLVADWSHEARARFELICLRRADEAEAAALCDDLGVCTGHSIQLRGVEESWNRLWRRLASEATASASQLPRIVEREQRDALWKEPDVRRLAALFAVIVVLGAVEGVQQYRLFRIDKTAAEKKRLEKEKSSSTQSEAKFNAELTNLAKDLDATRKQLEPLLNDRERLKMIVDMRQHLPNLLIMLSQAVANDAVLESLRNSKVGNNAASIQVVAWSPSYTGAQEFVSRVGELSREMGYGVAQTEIVQRKGRDNKAGHELSFWLIPESDDLGNSPATGSGLSAGPAPVHPEEKP